MGKFKKLSVILICFFAIIICCSCSCSCSESENDVLVTGLQLSDSVTTKEVSVGDTFTISYTITPTNATMTGVYVEISDKTIITADKYISLNATDLITFNALKDGECEIVFRSAGGNFSAITRVIVYKKTSLKTPTNIKFDGTKVTWDRVTLDILNSPKLSVNNTYKINIENITDNVTNEYVVNDYSFSGNDNFSFQNGKLYNIKLMTLGDGVRNSDSLSYSEIYRFYKLSSPTNVSISNGVISWNSVQSATHYLLKYLSTNKYVVVPSSGTSNVTYNFASLKENEQAIYDYALSIKPISTSDLTELDTFDEEYINSVDGVDYVSGGVSEEKLVHRVATPNVISLNNTEVADYQQTTNITISDMVAESILNYNKENMLLYDKINYVLHIKSLTSSKSIDVVLNPNNNLKINYDFLNLYAESDKLDLNLSNENMFEINISATAKSGYLDMLIDASSSETVRFAYYPLSSTDLNINIDSDGILTYTPKTFGTGNSYNPASNYEFIFIDNETHEWAKVNQNLTQLSEYKFDIKNILSTAGTYSIYLNMVGKTESNYLGNLNLLMIPLSFEMSGDNKTNFTTLSSPINLDISSSGLITWEEVANAENYIITLSYDVSGVIMSHSQTTANHSLDVYTFETSALITISSDVNYTINITATRSDIIGSTSENLYFTKLASSISINYGSDTISFNTVANASGYYVAINYSVVEGVNVFTWYKITQSTGSMVTINNLSKNATLMTNVGDSNTIYVYAVGSDKNNILDGEVATSSSINRIATPENLALVNDEDNGASLNWEDNGVSGITYVVEILQSNYNGGIENATNVISGFETQSCSLNLNIITNTSICFARVYAYSSNSIASQVSNNFYFKKLETPTLTVSSSDRINYTLDWTTSENYLSYVSFKITGLGSAIFIGSNETPTLSRTLTLENGNGLEFSGVYNVGIKLTADIEFTTCATPSTCAKISSQSKSVTIVKLPNYSALLNANDYNMIWNTGSANGSLIETYTQIQLIDHFELRAFTHGNNTTGDVKINQDNISKEAVGYNCSTLSDGNYDFALNAIGVVDSAHDFYVINTIGFTLPAGDSINYTISNGTNVKTNVVKLAKVAGSSFHVYSDTGQFYWSATRGGVVASGTSEEPIGLDSYDLYLNGTLLTGRNISYINNTGVYADYYYEIRSVGSGTNYSYYYMITFNKNNSSLFYSSGDDDKILTVKTHAADCLTSDLSDGVVLILNEIETLEKVCDNSTDTNYIEFSPLLILSGADQAVSYTLTITFGEQSGKYTLASAYFASFYTDGIYRISINDLKTSSKITRTDDNTLLDFVAAGTYTINIKALGKSKIVNSVNYFYLGTTEGTTKNIIKLSTPSQLAISVYDGKLSIAPYSGDGSPLGITLYFYKDNGSGEYIFQDGSSSTANYTTNITASMGYDSTKSYLFDTSEFLASGTYQIKLQFNGNEGMLISSTISSDVYNNGTNPIEKLAVPKVYIEMGVLKWTTIATANYDIYEYNEESSSYEKINATHIENTHFDTATWLAGEHIICLQAVKDGALSSCKSNSDTDGFLATKLVNPMNFNISVNAGVSYLNFDELDDAYSYFIIMDNNFVTPISDEIMHGSGTSVSWEIPNTIPLGSRKFYVIAIGSNTTISGSDYSSMGYLSSSHSSEDTEITINFVGETVPITLNNGILNWESVEQITAYTITIYSNYGLLSQTSVKSTSTTLTYYDLKDLNFDSGNYVCEVIVKANGITAHITTKKYDEGDTLIDVDREYMNVLKIQSLGAGGTLKDIHDNYRVENGMLAYDISNIYLTDYAELLSATTTDTATQNYYNTNITLTNFKEFVTGNITDQTLIQLFYPLTNFVININNVESNSIFSSYYYNASNQIVTLYYSFADYSSNEYSVKLASIGNTLNSSSDSKLVGVISGNFTSVLVAIKPAKPVCPIGQYSIENGQIYFNLVSGFAGNYYVYVKNVSDDSEYIRYTVVISYNPNEVPTLLENQWAGYVLTTGSSNARINLAEHVSSDGLGLNKPLIEGERYSVIISTSGTLDSSAVGFSGNIYFDGVKNQINDTFSFLFHPSTFNVMNGEIEFSSVIGALSYEINFYAYNSSTSEYSETSTLTDTIDNIEENETYTYIIDKDLLPSGNYKITIKAIGNGRNVLNSSEAVIYGVMLAGVEYSVVDGILTFDQITYSGVNGLGEISGQLIANNYKIQVVEITEEGQVLSDWFTQSNAVLIDGKYYFDLPNTFNSTTNKYYINVCAVGNNEYLLNSKTNRSNAYYRSASINSESISLTENGLLNWINTEENVIINIADSTKIFNAIYFKVGETSTYRCFTSSNFFNIYDNQIYYTKNGELINYRTAGMYSVNLSALNDNSSGEIYLRSPKSININLRVIDYPSVQITDGQINWETELFNTINTHLTSTKIVVSGTFEILNESAEWVNMSSYPVYILCPSGMTSYTAGSFMAELINLKGTTYYLLDLTGGDTTNATNQLRFVPLNNYSVNIQYVGDVVNAGSMVECDDESFYMPSTYLGNAILTNVQMLTTPTNVDNGNKINGGITFTNLPNNVNYIVWDKVNSATKYLVEVYHYQQIGSVTDLSVQVLLTDYLVDSTSDYLKIDGDKVYFAFDMVVELIRNTTLNNKTMLIYVTAIGGDSPTDYHLNSYRTASAFVIEFPEAPTNISYSNTTGQISWHNVSTGTIYLEVTYVWNTLVYGSVTSDYIALADNYSDIISRSIDGGTNYVTDFIMVSGQTANGTGVYSLKYLTGSSAISGFNYGLISIKAKTVTLGNANASGQFVSDITSRTSPSGETMSLFAGGDGSINNPFIIETEEQLINVNYYTSSNFKLNNDIVLSSVITPIGYITSINYSAFNGSFDGNNYTLSKVKLSSVIINNISYAGLFYTLGTSGEIKNLNVNYTQDNSHKVLGNSKDLFVGGVAVINNGTIASVSVLGSIYASSGQNNITYFGGISKENNGAITNCTNLMTTMTTNENNACSYVGGITYSNFGTLNKCAVGDYTNNTIIIGVNVGGVACINAHDISECSVNADIRIYTETSYSTSMDAYCGGIVGYSYEIEGKDDNMLSACYFVGTITITKFIATGFNYYVGGVAGMAKAGTEFNRCYVNYTYTDNNSQFTNEKCGKVFGYNFGYTNNSNSSDDVMITYICYSSSMTTPTSLVGITQTGSTNNLTATSCTISEAVTLLNTGLDEADKLFAYESNNLILTFQKSGS